MLNACKEKTYHSQLALLYKNTVPLIEPDSLAAMLKQEDTLLLLDTRAPEEWLVSRLPGARFAGFETFDSSGWMLAPKDMPVVLYCSIGWRSEKIGERMQQAGFKKVYNLYGGIIEWKNLGHPLLGTNGEPTEEVHTYNRYWGIYLTNGIRVYEK